MNNTDLMLGRKYQLPHGIGVLAGFEEFYDNGMKSRVVTHVPMDSNARCIFTLDKGHTWSNGDKPYAAWNNQITEVENVDL